MTERPASAHAQHDLELIAAFAAGELDQADRTRAGQLVSSCTGCAELAADLTAISRAVAALPAPARTRDFQLRPEDAARLRPRGWRRLLAALGPSRLELARPVAPVLMTLGIVGLLVAAAPVIPLGFGSAASAPGGGVTDRSAPAAASSAAPSAGAAAQTSKSASPGTAPEPMAGNAASSPSVPRDVAGGPYGAQASSTPLSDITSEGGQPGAVPNPPEASVASGYVPPAASPNIPLAAISAVALLCGLVLVVVRRASRSF
jgi:anti-sigma factor RsiW